METRETKIVALDGITFKLVVNRDEKGKCIYAGALVLKDEKCK